MQATSSPAASSGDSPSVSMSSKPSHSPATSAGVSPKRFPSAIATAALYSSKFMSFSYRDMLVAGPLAGQARPTPTPSRLKGGGVPPPVSAHTVRPTRGSTFRRHFHGPPLLPPFARDSFRRRPGGSDPYHRPRIAFNRAISSASRRVSSYLVTKSVLFAIFILAFRCSHCARVRG